VDRAIVDEVSTDLDLPVQDAGDRAPVAVPLNGQRVIPGRLAAEPVRPAGTAVARPAVSRPPAPAPAPPAPVKKRKRFLFF
jgi:hypothetical protein